MSAMVFSFSSCVKSGLHEDYPVQIMSEKVKSAQDTNLSANTQQQVSPVILCKQRGNARVLVLKGPPVDLRGMRCQDHLGPLYHRNKFSLDKSRGRVSYP